MSLRALTLFLLLITAAMSAAAQHNAIGGAAISGAVRTTDGKPVSDAQVEVRNAMNGQVVTSGYTSFNGTYQFMGLQNGSYEIVVTSGLSQATDRVQLQGVEAMSNLTLPAPGGDTRAGDAHTVSVAQMKVPEKARDALKKAEKAMAKRDLEEASRQTEKALEIYPQYAQAYSMRGLLKMDAGDYPAAAIELEHAIELDVGYAMGFIILGSDYNQMQRFDDAVRVLDRGLALNPHSWQAQFEMGRAYLAKNDLAASLRYIDKAAVTGPKDYAPIHLVRANIMLAQKNYPEAMNELESFLQTDPNGVESEKARKVLGQMKAYMAPK